MGRNGEQILCYQTPPGQLENFKKQLCRMNADSGKMVYVYFHSPTCPRDFPGTDFLIFRYSGCGESGTGPVRIFFLLKDISESIRLRTFKPSRLE